MPSTGFVALFSLLFALVASLPPANPLGLNVIDKDPERLALIVGINKYEHAGTDDQLEDLTGCVNDANRVTKVLKKRFDFKEQDIVLLTDEKASHEAIVKTFHDHLIQKASKNTEVLFWYSGHGSRVPDGSGIASAEFQGKDSTFVAFNSRARGNGHSFDFTDDELHSLIRALCKKTERLTVITDSCNSGGGTRGPAGRSSRAAIDGGLALTEADIKHFWPASVPFLEDGDPGRSEPLDYVHIAACSSTERAEEIIATDSRGRSRNFGAMSWYLIQALEKMSPGTTYREITRQVGLQVNLHFEGQNVQVEGGIDRVIFQGNFAPPPPGFAAIADPEGGYALEIEAGSIHFLRKGSIMEIVDPVADKVLGKAEVVKVYTYSSRAKWIGKEPNLRSLASVRAIEVERPMGDDPIALFVDSGKLEDQIVDILKKDGAGVIEISREPGIGVDYQLFPPPGNQGKFQIWTTTSSLPLWQETSTSNRVANIAKGVLETLRKEVRFKQILGLAESGNPLSVEASFQETTEETLKNLRDWHGGEFVNATIRNKVSRGIAGDRSGNQILVDSKGYDVSDISDFVISIPPGKGSKAMFVTVLCVSEDRTITIPWPKANERNQNKIEPGVPKAIPLMVWANPDWPLERPMRDRYIVIATESWADFSIFVNKESQLVAKPKFSGKRALSDEFDSEHGFNGLPEILKQAFLGQSTRGGPSIKPKRTDFSVVALDAHMVTGN